MNVSKRLTTLRRTGPRAACSARARACRLLRDIDLTPCHCADQQMNNKLDIGRQAILSDRVPDAGPWGYLYFRADRSRT